MGGLSYQLASKIESLGNVVSELDIKKVYTEHRTLLIKAKSVIFLSLDKHLFNISQDLSRLRCNTHRTFTFQLSCTHPI